MKLEHCLNNSLFTLLLLFFLGSSMAQVGSFKNFGIEKNAFPSRIECMTQARTGELYIGTLAGLVIYDGYEFHQVFERDGLAENAISSICAQGDNVWLGHWAGSLTIYNTVSHNKTIVDLRERLGYTSITRIMPKSDSSAVVVTNDGRLYSYSPSGLEQVVTGIPIGDEHTITIIEDTSGYFLVGNRGIFHSPSSKLGQASFDPIFMDSNNIGAAQYLENESWIIGDDREVFILNLRAGTHQTIHTLKPHVEVVSILEDQEEYIWISTSDDGIIRYHPITGESVHIKRENGLSYNQIRSLFLDREGQVWIATSAGLDQYLGQSFLLFDKAAGISDNLIWDIAELGNSVITASPVGLEIVEFDQEKTKVLSKRLFNLGQDEPRKIIARQNGEMIYVITAMGDLWLGGLNQTFERVSDLKLKANCLEEVNGEIWVGTDQGVIKLFGDRILEQYASELGLGGDRVNGIYYSKIKNETWVTVLGGSCALYREGRFKLFGPDEGMTSNVIQDAAFDMNGNPWFATYDEGVFYLEDGVFHNLSEKVELSSNTTFAIEIDDEQSVWIGHNWGLDLYRIPYEDVSSFGAAQGFLGLEVNSGAIEIDAQKNIWMGTLMGLLKFRPTKFRANLNEPISTIHSAYIGNEPIENEGVYRLDFDESTVTINASGLSLADPESNKFEYRLNGVHAHWRVTTNPSEIEYVSLPPGAYKFEFRTCNNSGKCNEVPVSLEFTIRPPLYKTWWFYTLLFFLVVVVIFLMDRFRVLSLIDEKNTLGEQILLLEQQVLELDQDKRSLIDKHAQNNEFFDQISDGHALATRNDIFLKQKTLEHQSSDIFIQLKVDDHVIEGLIDLGIGGESGALFMEKLRGAFFSEIRSNPPKSESGYFKILGDQVQRITERLEKHKGVNWVIWIEMTDKYVLSVYDNVCYQISGNQVVEYYGAKDEMGGTVFELPKTDRLFVASDGVRDQISAGGTRTYSDRKLLNKLTQNFEMSSDLLIRSIFTDIESWKGGMDQGDDITLMIKEL